MTKLELPNYFFSNKAIPNVYAHYFISDAYSNKTKIQLNANLISFLFEGSKELYHEDYSRTITDNEFVLAKSGNCLMSEKLSNNQRLISIKKFSTSNFDLYLLIKFLETFFFKNFLQLTFSQESTSSLQARDISLRVSKSKNGELFSRSMSSVRNYFLLISSCGRVGAWISRGPKVIHRSQFKVSAIRFSSSYISEAVN